jgi:alkanesulfonate monooxygenase SsuD/methylene tetrahydromethanopterin reductase-like flavin-dependent oxidoreductase (luciferase family)
MLIILPWHHPVRLAEELIQLQYMLDGRDMTIGLGRGLGMREYAGFDLHMAESRERFREGLEILRLGLSQEAFSYQGHYFKVPNEDERAGKISLRPRPRDAQKLLDSLYGGWLSPASGTTVAGMGLKPMIIPNRDLRTYIDDLRAYAKVRAEAGFAPTHSCVTNSWVFCAENGDEVDEVRRHIDSTGIRSTGINYEFAKGYHGGVPGYEFYAVVAESLKERGFESFPASEAVRNKSLVFTPDELISHIQMLYDWYTQDGCIPPDRFVFTFRCWSLPVEKAEKSMKLFAKEVLPFIKELKVLDV